MPDSKKPVGLDWAEAYARLAKLARSAEADTASPAQTEAVLEARARELARPLAATIQQGERVEVARFRSGGQSYALETRFIHEVLRGAELTPLPGAPPLLRGLTLLRGEVLPLVELAPLFGRPATQVGDVILVIGLGRAELGLCVDEAEEVSFLPRSSLLVPPAALEASAQGLVSGIDRDGLILLEAEALLRDSRLVFDIADEGSV